MDKKIRSTVILTIILIISYFKLEIGPSILLISSALVFQWEDIDLRYIVLTTIILAPSLYYQTRIDPLEIGSKIYLDSTVTKVYDRYENFQRVEVKDKTGRKISLATDGSKDVMVTDRILGTIEIVDNYSYDNFGMYNTQDYYFQEGITDTGKATSTRWEKNTKGLSSIKRSIIETIEKRIHINISKENRPIVEKLILSTGSIDQNIVESHSQGGLSHILAISGLHISLLILLLDMVLKRLHIGFNTRLAVLSVTMIFYCYILGYPPGAVRATLMYIISQVSETSRIKVTSLDILGITAVIMLLFNPRYLFNPGFIFSFMSVVGLLLYGDKINIAPGINEFIAVHITILPIIFYYYSQFNPISIVANLLIAPIYMVVLVCGFVGVFSNWVLLLKLCDILISFAQYILRILLEIWPFNIKYSVVSILSLVIYYMIIYCVRNTDFKKLVYSCRRELSLVFVILSVAPILISDDSLYLGFYDVGQGDSAYIIYEDNYIQIDTGGVVFGQYNPGVEVTGKSIEKRGYYVDGLILSHWDRDHVLGTHYLMENDLVDTIIFKDKECDDEYALYVKENFSNIYNPSRGDKIIKGDLTIHLLNTEINENRDDNDDSLVVLLEFKGHRVLFTGDMSSKYEDDLSLGPVDILKLGHHGSKYSSSVEFLQECDPKYSIISVGKNNYGHPSGEVLDRLRSTQSQVLSTYDQGEIIFNIGDSIDYISHNGVDRSFIDLKYVVLYLLGGIILGFLLIQKGGSYDLF